MFQTSFCIYCYQPTEASCFCVIANASVSSTAAFSLSSDVVTTDTNSAGKLSVISESILSTTTTVAADAAIKSRFNITVEFSGTPPDAISHEDICSTRCHCFTKNRVSLLF